MAASFKIIVIDDDPTGSQTVHSCPLLLRWDAATLAAGLRHPSPLLFLLANTRALAPEAAAERVRQICRALAAALPLAACLFKAHKPLQKAGVLLQNLQPTSQLQHSLLAPLPEQEQQRRELLLATIDGLNHRYGSGTVAWAACGLRPAWAMKRQQLSCAATTRLAAIPMAWAR